MMWVVRIVVALFFCFTFYGAIQHYLPQLDAKVSVVMAVVAATFTTLLATFDFVKKLYDVRKAPYELRKLEREEEAAEKVKKSVITPPTLDEMKMYGQSPTERALKERFKNVGPDALKPKRFVIDSSEEKL